MSFYERVKGLCEQRGISITSMILTLGFSKSAASTWKASGNMPRPNTVKKVADYFGLTVEQLKDGIDEDYMDYESMDTSNFNQPVFRHLLDKHKGNVKQAIKAYFEFEKAQAQDAMNDPDRLAIYQNNGGVVGVQGHAHAPVTVGGGIGRTLTEQEAEMWRIFSELSVVQQAKVLVYASDVKNGSL